MKIRFWGVRGSIPSPGPHTVRYGGNTTCLEVRSDAGDIIILDAGTGIFPLAQSLLRELPVTAHLFISHSHWDHIQGLPFFIPIFIPGNHLHIHGAFDPITQKGIREVLGVQMEYSYFPVREAELKARMEYVNLQERQAVQAGSTTVMPVLMNHPVLNFGYRVECNGKAMFFTGDHEPPYNIYAPEDDFYEQYQELMAQKDETILEVIRGVDVLVADSAYTPEEYVSGKVGWGHGTYDTSIDLARRAGVKTVVCTHHEPTRDDARLEAVFAEALERNPRQPGDPEILLAREGLEIEV